ncbi:MAG: rane protein [Firmicutes bacterium]|nr:rane protein [Bacillota bacterium]
MIVLGIITQEQALHHIDFNTLGLLSGMMILVGITAQTGLFSYLAIWAAKKVDADPLKLFFVLSLLTAVLSAFLDNVTTVLLTVPVTISITRQLEIKPAPYLIAQIIASNIGGTATLVGDPPNIMIGSAVKELTFMAFINNLAAVSVVILIISLLILALIYFPEMKTSPALRQKILEIDETKQITNHTLLMICIGVLSLTILLFTTHQFFHLATATIALFGASVLLLFTSVSGKPSLERIFHKIEWTALFFFIGLFILVGGLIETGVISYVAQKSIALTAGNLTFTALLLLWVSAIASAFVDNIPFVATMIPLIKDMGTLGLTHLEPLWWSLSLGACLGGNGTLVGASANIIVAGLAAQEGYPLSFTGYLRVGFPLMLLSIVIASLYIYFRYLC